MTAPLRSAAPPRWPWLLWLAGLLGVVALSVAARSAPYFHIDVALTQALQSAGSPTLDALALAIDWFGYVPQVFIMVSLCALMLWVAGRRWEGVWLMLAMSTEGTWAQFIKFLVKRPRPSEAAGVRIIQLHGDATYPSGHVFFYVVVFGLLLYFAYRYTRPSPWHRVAAVLLAAFTLVAGVVRMYLGAHWFSDVLAGYLLGALWLPVVILSYEWAVARFRPRPTRRQVRI
jgi:membrane-associated phospholipid phosphatase